MITTNLEQSKKLKELGAPQEADIYWCTDLGELTFSKNCEPFEKRTCGDHLAVYDLSMLIEWLGDNFRELYKQSGKWHAGGVKQLAKDLKRNAHTTGATPLDAVFTLAVAVKGKEEGE